MLDTQVLGNRPSIPRHRLTTLVQNMDNVMLRVEDASVGVAQVDEVLLGQSKPRTG